MSFLELVGAPPTAAHKKDTVSCLLSSEFKRLCDLPQQCIGRRGTQLIAVFNIWLHRSRACHFSILLKVPIAFDEFVLEATILCQTTFTPTDVFVSRITRPSLRVDANTNSRV